MISIDLILEDFILKVNQAMVKSVKLKKSFKTLRKNVKS
jgi:hypothetical protein